MRPKKAPAFLDKLRTALANALPLPGRYAVRVLRSFVRRSEGDGRQTVRKTTFYIDTADSLRVFFRKWHVRKVGMNDTSSRTLLRSVWCIALVLLFCCVQGAGRKAYVQETTLDAQHVELIESFTPAAPSHTRYFIESGTAVLPDISSSRAKRLFHPILFLFFLALYPVCTRALRACPLREVLLPRLSDIRGLLPLPLAPPSLFF